MAKVKLMSDNGNPPHTSHHYRITSQHGENGLLLSIIRKLQLHRGYAVEIGAADGLRGSNTYPLSKRGWKILMIEGDENEYNKLIYNTRDNENIYSYKDYARLKGNHTLNKILDKNGVSKNFDLISIDMDGTDYWVWKDFRYIPKIIIIEYEGSLGSDIKLYPRNSTIEEKVSDVYGAATAEAFRKLGIEKGYDLVAITRPNLIFVRRDLSEPFQILDKNNLEKHRKWFHKNVDYDRIFKGWEEKKREFDFDGKDNEKTERIFTG